MGALSRFFGTVRESVLRLLLGKSEVRFYQRKIIAALDLGSGAVQRELQNLTAMGVLIRSQEGRQVYYQANQAYPLFSELRALMIRSLGLEDALRDAVTGLGDAVRVAFIYGSFANGTHTESSDVDVMIIGRPDFATAHAAVSEAERKTGREINLSLYSPDEFHRKIVAGHHFLTTVLAGPMVYLAGSKRELGRLAPKRVAEGTSDKRARDRGSAQSG